MNRMKLYSGPRQVNSKYRTFIQNDAKEIVEVTAKIHALYSFLRYGVYQSPISVQYYALHITVGVTTANDGNCGL
jgi:hypothetical protein